MLKCEELQRLIPKLFGEAKYEICADMAARQDFSSFPDLPEDVRAHLDSCQDCPNDLLWFLKIRSECDVYSFPCIHVAYACSPHAEKIISKHHGHFVLATNRQRDEGIVIGFCPWCAKDLSLGFLD